MFGKKARKERRKLKERHKKMFLMHLDEFRRTALDRGMKLREVYWEHHNILQSRQATNIITSDRMGRGERTRGLEIDSIMQSEEKAEEIFREALDEFIEEVGKTAPAETAEEDAGDKDAAREENGKDAEEAQGNDSAGSKASGES
jgi:hypothetical protein